MAIFALPSARMILLKLLPMIKKGMDVETMRRYCDAYPTVSSLTGSAKINMIIMAMIPMPRPVQKQKEEAFLAFSVLPSPRDLEIREVPPMPNSIPMAMNKRNAGVATEIAATM